MAILAMQFVKGWHMRKRARGAENGFSILPPAGWTKKGVRPLRSTGEFMLYRGPTEEGFAPYFTVTAWELDVALDILGPAFRERLGAEIPPHLAATNGYLVIDGKKSYSFSTAGTLYYVIPGGNGKQYIIKFISLSSNFAKYRPLFESTAMTAATD
jgi:hypothetical protein